MIIKPSLLIKKENRKQFKRYIKCLIIRQIDYNLFNNNLLKQEIN